MAQNPVIPVVGLGLYRHVAASMSTHSERTPYRMAAIVDLTSEPGTFNYTPHNLGVVLHTMDLHPKVFVSGTAISPEMMAESIHMFKEYVKNTGEEETLIINAPTIRLPPLRNLSTFSSSDLLDCIAFLRLLYTPEIRGSRIRHRNVQQGSEFSSDGSKLTRSSFSTPHVLPLPEADELAALRSDAFERAYTIRWLTGLLAYVEISEPGADQASAASSKDIVIQEAAALLANCAGTAGAGVVSRLLTFPSGLGPIRICLTDLPLENRDFASVGAQTWGGACVLAEIIAACPADFGLLEPQKPLRVLELGSGTGLVGLAFGKVAQQRGHGRVVTVISTDFYPTVLQNLAANITANFPSQDGSVSISSHFLDWSTFSGAETPSLPPCNEPFDLILGADIVYEPEHAAWIHSCVCRLLSRQSLGDGQPTFHLLIPLRATHALESGTIETVFAARSQHNNGLQLIVLSKEAIICGIEGRDREEVEYGYYKIGWKRDT
ncbi:putative methyltransferase-domain-containing protein [Mycena sp. CBHHK59/15]|nr:putative methyltransferase-domain-containing protein [Mycena sp. CBHHK59/15]